MKVDVHLKPLLISPDEWQIILVHTSDFICNGSVLHFLTENIL